MENNHKAVGQVGLGAGAITARCAMVWATELGQGYNARALPEPPSIPPARGEGGCGAAGGRRFGLSRWRQTADKHPMARALRAASAADLPYVSDNRVLTQCNLTGL